MKRSLVLLLLLLLFSGLQRVAAQGRVHLGAGLNVSYAQLDSFNFVIDRFNEDNPTYPRQLQHINVPLGFFAAAGGNFSRVLVELSFTMRTAGARARSNPDNGGNDQRVILRYNAHTFEVGTGYFLLNKEYSQLAVGVSLDFGQTRLLARRGDPQQVANQPWSRLVNELNFGTTVFLQGMIVFKDSPRLGVYFRPYYQLGLVRNDYGPVNRFLRPNNWQSDPYFILARPSNAGLKVGMYLGS